MNPNSSLQTSTDLRLPTTVLRPPSPDSRPLTPNHRPPPSGLRPPASGARAPRGAGFTLVELLVVISIIGLLAGLAVPAIGGALKTAKKSEVGAVAQSIRTAILAWNSEYGTWPTNGLTGTDYFETTATFYTRMATTNDTNNPRGVIFLEIPAKFLDGESNIVTPSGFIKGTTPKPLRFKVDADGSGLLTGVGYEGTNLRTSVAVWARDPDKTNSSIGTWK